jgi:hypothetical protein
MNDKRKIRQEQSLKCATEFLVRKLARSNEQ